MAFAALFIGFLMSASSGVLYRVLEGYSWHRTWLWKPGVARQLKRKQGLKERLSTTEETFRKAEIRAQLRQFPIDDRQVLPTAFGNALRAFETYGYFHYRLDSQTLWSELVSVVPGSLRIDLSLSRALVDFFVALIYLDLAFVLSTTGSGFVYGDPAWSVPVVAGFALWPLYVLAIRASRFQRFAIQALVNIGRPALAQQLGLRLPPDLDGERTMWRLVSRLAADNYEQAEDRKADRKALDRYRSKDSTPIEDEPHTVPAAVNPDSGESVTQESEED